MDSGYKTPWIAKKTLDDGRIPILHYTRYNGKKDRYRPSGMENGLTEAGPKSASTVHTRQSAWPMKKGRSYS